jgi:hypothetical protein
MFFKNKAFDDYYNGHYERDCFESEAEYLDHRKTAKAAWNAAIKWHTDSLNNDSVVAR